MKYLKKFNESKDDKLYRKVRYNDGNIEFGLFFTGRKRNTLDKLLTQMDNRVLAEIEKYKTDYHIKFINSGWLSNKESEESKVEFANYIQMYNRKPFQIYIEKIYEIYQVIDNYYFIIEKSRFNSKYWICDQLEGLIEFLKYRKVI